MAAIVLAIGGLAIVTLGVRWFLRANPTRLARHLRRGLLAIAALAILLTVIFSIRFLPVLPELLGLVGLIATALLPRLIRGRSRGSGGFSTPGSGGRTEVRTGFLRAWIDHASGDVGGAVLAGRFAGRTLDNLADDELRTLHEEVANDADSRRVLEAYLERRLGEGWQTERGARRSTSSSDMSRDEALAVLGLADGATVEEIRAAHRRLIQRMHPDVGGSADLAARINRAKDILLD